MMRPKEFDEPTGPAEEPGAEGTRYPRLAEWIRTTRRRSPPATERCRTQVSSMMTERHSLSGLSGPASSHQRLLQHGNREREESFAYFWNVHPRVGVPSLRSG